MAGTCLGKLAHHPHHSAPRRQGHILPRTRTWINPTRIAQLLPRRKIMPSPLALRIRTNRPAAVRPLNPRNPQPPKIVDHRVHELIPAALRIQIFIAQDQLPAVLGGTPRRNPKSPRVPHMQQPGGRRREPPAIKLKIGFVRQELALLGDLLHRAARGRMYGAGSRKCRIAFGPGNWRRRRAGPPDLRGLVPRAQRVGLTQ